jgi:hypothetical protein
MQIEVLEVVENTDGSMYVELELDQDASKIMLEIGFNEMLRRATINTNSPNENQLEMFDDEHTEGC